MPSQKRSSSSQRRGDTPGGPSRPGMPARARRASPVRASLGMEQRVRDVLIPVEPSQQFVRDLGRGLGVAARRSRQSLVQRYRTGILIGAAIFGSLASVVGVVVLILRQRARVRGVLAHSQVFTQEGGA